MVNAAYRRALAGRWGALLFAIPSAGALSLMRAGPLWRYLSDGSYWMYIVHMPVVMAFQIALAGVPIPTEAKVLVVVAGSLLALVASYDLVARPSWIGVLLNGRRHPRRYFVRALALDAPSLAVARPQ